MLEPPAGLLLRFGDDSKVTVVEGELGNVHDGLDITSAGGRTVLGGVISGKPRIRDQWYSASQLELDSESGHVIARCKGRSNSKVVILIAPAGQVGPGVHVHPASGSAGALLRLTKMSIHSASDIMESC